MGTMYATLTDSGERVAVKVIHPMQTDDPDFRARFRREVRLSARVRGPFLLPPAPARGMSPLGPGAGPRIRTRP